MAGVAGHPFVAPGLAGVLAHAVVNRHEPDSIKSMLTLVLGPPLILTFGARLSFFPSFAVYILALVTSTILYRISPFHPLAKFPGPPFARTSRIWWSYVSRAGHQHLIMQQLHEKYGNVVRIGPNHLSIRDAAAIPAMFSARSSWPKHAKYDVARPYGASAQILQLEGAEHAKRRRLWDRAFTPGSLVSYTPMLQARMAELVHALAARAGPGARVNLAMWIQFLTLDFMGDFAYGGEFNALRAGADPGGLLAKIAHGLVFFSLAGAFPWLRPVLGPLTRLGGPTADIFAASRTVGERRQQRAATVKDLFYYILGEDGGGGEPLHPDALAAEASVGIIAGSDTSGRTLANAMFYLITHPGAFRRLREEADAVAKEQGDAHAFLDPGQLAELPFLRAVLNETMRLQPITPSGLPRTAPRGGGLLVVGDYVIPEGTGAQICSYALQRDPRYFSPRPEAFWPERWLPEGRALAEKRGEEFVLSSAAFAPWSVGPHNCAGRALALFEMRDVLAELVRRFDFSLAEGMTADVWHAGLRDWHVLATGSLWVVLEERS